MIEFDPTLVHEWLSRNAKLHPDKEALICNEQRWTYSAIDKHTSHLAMQLIKMGLNRQRRVAILLDDPVSDIISIYGTLKAGAVFVNLEKSLKAPKLSYILENSGASLLITDTSKANIIAEAFDSLQTDCKILWTGDMRNIPDDLKEISSSWGNYFADFSEEIDVNICKKNLPNYRSRPCLPYLHLRVNR
jgi:acyl-CoA synthetase (AMP-forming)/AMP-acid ligase II